MTSLVNAHVDAIVLTTISSGTLMLGQGNPNQPGSIISNVLDNATLVFKTA